MSDLHIGEVGPFGNFGRVLCHYHVVRLAGVLRDEKLPNLDFCITESTIGYTSISQPVPTCEGGVQRGVCVCEGGGVMQRC